MPSTLERMAYIQNQMDAGLARGKENRLADLYKQAMTTPREQRQGVIAEMAGVNPQAAFDANKHFESMDDGGRERLGQYAAAFDALPDEMKAQAYPNLARQAQELGIPAPPEWNPAYAPHIQKLAQSLRGGTSGNTVQSTKIGADGYYYTVDRMGNWVRSNVQANPNIQILEQEGQLPVGVVKSGGVAGSVVPLGGGASAPQRAPGEVPFSIDPSLPPQVQAAIRADEGQFANAPSGGTVQVASPAIVRTPTAAERAAAAEAAKQGVDLSNMPVRGQLEADNAARKAAAEEQVKLGYLPERGSLEADAAAKKSAAEAAAKAKAERESIAATKTVDAQKTLDLLEEAEKLIPASTGSAVGNIVDTVAGMAGVSTDGAQNIAALRTIAGQLTSSMPRMQGPQSDKDVLLYQQMAGDLANPSLPKGTRLAALKTIRRLNQKYAGTGGQMDKAAPRTIRYDAKGNRLP